MIQVLYRQILCLSPVGIWLAHQPRSSHRAVQGITESGQKDSQAMSPALRYI